VAAAVVALGAWLLWPRGPRTIQAVEITGTSCVRALDPTGRALWLQDFVSPVGLVELMRDRHGRQRVLAGMAPAEGPACGDVVMLDARGQEVWRVPGWTTAPYTGGHPLKVMVKAWLVADLLPEPGTEIVVAHHAQLFPSRASILSENGKLLGELWHPGYLMGILRIGTTDRLVFWGANNDLPGDRTGGTGQDSPHVVLCIEAGKLSGQCPPYRAPGVPKAPLLWYHALTPLGRCFLSMTTSPTMGPPGTALQIHTREGWYLYLDADGKRLERGNDPSAKDPPSDLTDVLAAPTAAP
jgi:hypothetical protein